MRAEPARASDIRGARVLGIFGDIVTTDHISPMGAIAKGTPAAEYLTRSASRRATSSATRRGALNHDVMIRGTFASTRCTTR